MSVPDFQTLMLPLLRLCADEKEHSIREAVDTLAKEFNLSEIQLKETLPSGKQTTFKNRVAWAKSYLKKGALIEFPKRSFFKITPLGKKVLANPPDRITLKYLWNLPVPNRKSSSPTVTFQEDVGSDSSQTPLEKLEAGYKLIRKQIEEDILSNILTCSDSFFEELVVDLLVSMGYGGSIEDAGQAVGKSHDGGIDGIIKEDRLGLDRVYIQAKRWDSNSVGRPEIQKFVGALLGLGANKGVFITTSTFTSGAREYSENVNSRIILVDGAQLAKYMYDFNVGVTPEDTYEIKKIDTDYFSG